MIDHEFRRTGIGGSDVAAVLGISRYKSAFQLWQEKTGQVQPEDISEQDQSYM
jgi:predicted phage-related endonuclease